MTYQLKFGSNEVKSIYLIDQYLTDHPQIAEGLSYTQYSETEGRHADVECYQQEKLLWVAEIKIDTDAKTSFNSGHMYNNFAQLRDNYPHVPKYLLMVDSHKRSRVPNPHGKGYHYEEAFSKALIARCSGLAQIVGKAIPYYMKDTRFGNKLWKLCKTPQKEVDCGIRYLERKPVSKYEQSLQAFDGITPTHAAWIAQRYPNWKALIWDATIWDRGRHEFVWDPGFLQLDGVFPPTQDNEESKRRLHFLEAIGGPNYV
jgi:hypothetical protein